MALENSILNSVKKALGLGAAYTAFDEDIMQYTNAALAKVKQLGVGSQVITITDATTQWSALGVPEDQINLAKPYVNLSVRLVFDPPTTSFTKDALTAQLKEYEWRLNTQHEYVTALTEEELPEQTWVIVDGGSPTGTP